MRFKVYYNRGIKMSPEKLASQVAHITLNLGYHLGDEEGYALGMGMEYYEAMEAATIFNPKDQTVIVLGLSHTKFESTLNSIRRQSQHTGLPHYHVQNDLGLTEVDFGTTTAFGFIEE